jgi:hypothetical protein
MRIVGMRIPRAFMAHILPIGKSSVNPALNTGSFVKVVVNAHIAAKRWPRLRAHQTDIPLRHPVKLDQAILEAVGTAGRVGRDHAYHAVLNHGALSVAAILEALRAEGPAR